MDGFIALCFAFVIRAQNCKKNLADKTDCVKIHCQNPLPDWQFYLPLCHWAMWFVKPWLYHSSWGIHVNYWAMSFRVAPLAMGQSYDCPSASEATLKDMVKIKQCLTTAKHNKVQTMGIICTMYCSNAIIFEGLSLQWSNRELILEPCGTPVNLTLIWLEACDENVWSTNQQRSCLAEDCLSITDVNSFRPGVHFNSKMLSYTCIGNLFVEIRQW